MGTILLKTIFVQKEFVQKEQEKGRKRKLNY